MLGAALSLLVPAIVAGCGGDSKPENTVPAVDITVGAMLPRTGPNANSDWVTAVELAMLDVNTAIKKAKIARPINFKLDEIDTASNEAMALAAMGTYAGENAKIVLTEASNAAIGANKFNYDSTGAQAASPIPVISFTATSSALNKMAPATEMDPQRAAALTDAGNWFFRTAPVSDALSNLRLGQVFSGGQDLNGDGKPDGDVAPTGNPDGKIKIVWIGSNDTSTDASIKGDIKAFKTFVDANGLTANYISEYVEFDPGADPTTFNYGPAIALATDAFANDNAAGNAAVATTADVPPDLIINKALPTIAIPFIKAYKQSAAGQIAIFQDGSFRRNTLLASLGSAADGQKGVSNIAYEATKGGDVFKAEQQAQTGFPPAAYEAQAYDATVIAMLAVVKASMAIVKADAMADPTAVTGAQVRDAMTDLNHAGEANVTQFFTGADEIALAIKAFDAGNAVDYSGASGNVNFDAVGNVLDRGVLWQITGGQFVETAYFDCVTSPACTKLADRNTMVP